MTDITAFLLQHGRYKNAEETKALCHQTICEKHTECIKNKQVELELLGHYVLKDCSSGEIWLSFHLGASITPAAIGCRRKLELS